MNKLTMMLTLEDTSPKDDKIAKWMDAAMKSGMNKRGKFSHTMCIWDCAYNNYYHQKLLSNKY